MSEIRYVQMVSGGEQPCTRCGKDARIFGRADEVVVMLKGRRSPVCEDCLLNEERIGHGERILAGLREQEDAIRREWLGSDYAELGDEARQQRASERDPVPDELRAVLDQIDKLEELLDDMRYVAKADAELLHHAVTGEWPAEP